MKKLMIILIAICFLIFLIIGIIYWRDISKDEYSIYNLNKLTDKELQETKHRSHNLHVIAAVKGDLKLAKYLLKRGLNPFEGDGTPFAVAVNKNYFELVKLYLKYGKDNNIKMFDYYFASGPWQKGTFEMFKFLENNGFDVTAISPHYGNQLGVFTIVYGDSKKVKNYTLSKLNKLQNIAINQYFVVEALLAENNELAELLLKNGVKYNIWLALTDDNNSPENLKFIKEGLEKVKNSDYDEVTHSLEKNVLLYAILSDNIDKLNLVYSLYKYRINKETSFPVYDKKNGRFEYYKNITPLEFAKLRNKQNAVKFIEEKLKEQEK